MVNRIPKMSTIHTGCGRHQYVRLALVVSGIAATFLASIVAQSRSVSSPVANCGAIYEELTRIGPHFPLIAANGVMPPEEEVIALRAVVNESRDSVGAWKREPLERFVA